MDDFFTPASAATTSLTAASASSAAWAAAAKALLAISIASCLFSVYLLYVLKVLLDDFCVVCTTFHVINFSTLFFGAVPAYRATAAKTKGE